MDSREVFEKTLEKEIDFKEHELTELIKMGSFIGRNLLFFKKIFKAYKFGEVSSYFEPELGAPVKVEFNHELKEVKFNRLKVELILSTDQFLKFMALIDMCFFEILPIGTVVNLHDEYTPENLKTRVSSNNGVQAMIIGQTIFPDKNIPEYFIDYSALLWPFGTYASKQPFFVANVMIKKVLHKGMTNDFEQAFKVKMKNQIIFDKKKSMVYLTESDRIEIEQKLK